MITNRITFTLLLWFLAVSAWSQNSRPVYAIYGIKERGQAGTVTIINIALLTSGKSTDCHQQIESFEADLQRGNRTGVVELVESQCVFVLPAPFEKMILSSSLPDAYVLKQSGNNGVSIFTAWYGLSRTDSLGMCKRLVDTMRGTLTPARANISCLPPE